MVPRIKPDLIGETVVIIGGGPSLTLDDVRYCKERAPVIAVNDAYRLAPWSYMLYACDLKWWQWHEAAARFHHNKWTTSLEAHEQMGIHYIRGADGDGLSTDPELIHFGQNSGYQAINIAYHLGASRVLLLGFDMSIAHNGQSHWFGDHPDKIRSSYGGWLKNFETIAEQNLIEIINCSRHTALKAFPQATINEVL